MDNLVFTSVAEQRVVALYDVTDCVKSWGRRGIAGGGILGFALGIAIVAIPFTSDVLAFGVAGTLLVAAVEGAVIAGAFGACAAALYGRGVPCGGDSAFDRTMPSGRRRPQGGWREGDIPLSDWPAAVYAPAPLQVRSQKIAEAPFAF